MSLRIGDHVARIATSPLAPFADGPPWSLTVSASEAIRALLPTLAGDYAISDGVAIHASATVEPGAVLKPPAILGPRVLVAHGAYVRGGVWLDEDCIVGPGVELKSAFIFRGGTLAHFNFVGDSVLGEGVNLEAGAIIANHRNEGPSGPVRFQAAGEVFDTGQAKFGALVGDGARLGANAVVAPGALLPRGAVVPRLGLVDQGA